MMNRGLVKIIKRLAGLEQLDYVMRFVRVLSLKKITPAGCIGNQPFTYSSKFISKYALVCNVFILLTVREA